LFLPAEVLTPEENFAQGWEPGHVHADRGDEDHGRDRADAGDLIQPRRLRGERGRRRLDLGVQGGDIGVDPVDPGQHPVQQERVAVMEVTGKASRN
jgi:hypothetical protein